MASDSNRGWLRKIPFRLLERLDTLGHKLRVPRRLRGPICDEYERRLQESFDWGYHFVAQNALNDGYSLTSSSSGNVDVSWKRKRHDA